MTMKHVNNQSNFAILLGTWYSVLLWWLLNSVPKHVFELNFFEIKFEITVLSNLQFLNFPYSK